MGSGKSIEGYSVFEEYTANTSAFLRNISQRLDAYLIVNTYDKDLEQRQENQRTDSGRQKAYSLSVFYNEDTGTDDRLRLPTYKLRMPIDYVFEETLQLSFHPNRVVNLRFLTFETNWVYFIDTLKFQYPGSRNASLDRYERLRKEYARVLRRLGIDRIFIATDACYHIEDLSDVKEYPELEFTDIPTFANQKDDLLTFQLEEILYARTESDVHNEFLSTTAMRIAFIDNLHFQ